MNYRRDKYGNKLSILGFGCMRFPMKAGRIDLAETEREILTAIEGGVNYFDTAYIYPGSEAALGEILERNGLRDRVHIATKLPHYLIKSREGLDKLFAEELRRLRTDHVDFYLMHMLTDTDTWERLKAMGIEEWIAEKKASGAIRQLGFSYHGNSDMFCKLLDAWDWDFCQIQYNYMDEHSQAGRRGLNHANGKGIPVVIMEPLRGGKLVSHLPEEAKRIFESYPVRHTPAQWAFRWLWNQPEVTVVLSGMNSDEMVRDNLRTASTVQVGELGPEEEAMLRQVVAAINSKMKVGCTGCGYCMPCPKNVDIPGTFAAYNRRYQEGKFWGFMDYVICTLLRKNPTPASNCIGCGKCEKHCPQHLPIRQKLGEARKELEGPLYRTVRKVLGRFAKF
ncbi:MAG: aldo/keto reductase [Oscillospiraceae bacterium]|nr:aldo/keto reductase [Oscillospiraceae bacterium]